ncbi:hypothetical protein FRX31_018124 [Thalictrum thalictroides]|uniref:Uncharacterized protein n=1 Tax=Thalictrum thalictroides TaxID=46969 RepID=A0A7J6W673_THATH|nr:hypothetical protein FRX31_018124 [Thalictrum thalictroides]
MKQDREGISVCSRSSLPFELLPWIEVLQRNPLPYDKSKFFPWKYIWVQNTKQRHPMGQDGSCSKIQSKAKLVYSLWFMNGRARDPTTIGIQVEIEASILSLR